MSDRKYGQRGYMEDDRERGRSGPKGPPRERPLGPRGRGLGKPTATVFRCAVCGERQPSDTVVALDTACWKCATDLHSCTHCRFFNTSAPGECRERAPYVASKAKRNSCEQFLTKESQEFSRGGGGEETPSDAKAAFDALFKL
ncbi:MAG: hypothetical protein GY719_14445 [bacterium]|nr:hypothetical protein [bacterium]